MELGSTRTEIFMRQRAVPADFRGFSLYQAVFCRLPGKIGEMPQKKVLRRFFNAGVLAKIFWLCAPALALALALASRHGSNYSPDIQPRWCCDTAPTEMR
jgi:hypothetical protein